MAANSRTTDSAPAFALPDEIVPPPLEPWPDEDFRAGPSIRSGALLGGIAGCVSLLVNIVGSVAWPSLSGHMQHPLRLIQVYLTFPLGEYALQLNSGLLLAFGCLLYVVTGILYGVIFEFAIEYLLPCAGVGARLLFFMILGLTVWLISFYGLLSWLQPLMFGGRWIVELIPWWVAASTHLVFAWTMALLYPMGRVRKPAARELRRRDAVAVLVSSGAVASRDSAIICVIGDPSWRRRLCWCSFRRSVCTLKEAEL